jgi:hypothetical protein
MRPTPTARRARCLHRAVTLLGVDRDGALVGERCWQEALGSAVRG